MVTILFSISWLGVSFLKFHGVSSELIWLNYTSCLPPIPPVGSELSCKRSISELICSIKCEDSVGKMVCNFETGNWNLDKHSQDCSGSSSFNGTAVIQNNEEKECGQLPAILHGKIICFKYTEKTKCYATCSPNYEFHNGKRNMNSYCTRGIWRPVRKIPECIPKFPDSNATMIASHKKTTMVDRCQRPIMPVPGEMHCIQKHGSHQCTARCSPNYKFSDGRLAISATCLFSEGVWIPFKKFPNCIKPTFKETWGCYKPQSTAHGQILCVSKSKTVSCFGKCEEGFLFPSNLHRSRIKCDKKRGNWLPSERSLTCSNPGSSPSEEPCCLPHVILPGRVFCFSSSSHHLICNGTCSEGYQFSDGRLSHTLYCSEKEGKFVPYEEFPSCIPKGGNY